MTAAQASLSPTDRGEVQLLRARNVPREIVVFPDDVHDSLL